MMRRRPSIFFFHSIPDSLPLSLSLYFFVLLFYCPSPSFFFKIRPSLSLSLSLSHTHSLSRSHTHTLSLSHSLFFSLSNLTKIFTSLLYFNNLEVNHSLLIFKLYIFLILTSLSASSSSLILFFTL